MHALYCTLSCPVQYLIKIFEHTWLHILLNTDDTTNVPICYRMPSLHTTRLQFKAGTLHLGIFNAQVILVASHLIQLSP